MSIGLDDRQRVKQLSLGNPTKAQHPNRAGASPVTVGQFRSVLRGCVIAALNFVVHLAERRDDIVLGTDAQEIDDRISIEWYRQSQWRQARQEI